MPAWSIARAILKDPGSKKKKEKKIKIVNKQKHGNTNVLNSTTCYGQKAETIQLCV